MKTLNYTQSNHTHRLFRRRAFNAKYLFLQQDDNFVYQGLESATFGRMTHVLFLGIIFDEKLSFLPHLKHLRHSAECKSLHHGYRRTSTEYHI